MNKEMILKQHKIFKRFSRTFQKDMEYAVGIVYNHPYFKDGEYYITTTAIVNIEGNKITTNSGSIYILE